VQVCGLIRPVHAPVDQESILTVQRVRLKNSRNLDQVHVGSAWLIFDSEINISTSWSGPIVAFLIIRMDANPLLEEGASDFFGSALSCGYLRWIRAMINV